MLLIVSLRLFVSFSFSLYRITFSKVNQAKLKIAIFRKFFVKARSLRINNTGAPLLGLAKSIYYTVRKSLRYEAEIKVTNGS